ncbi:hypothetical protein kpv41_12 [Klebsiella phage KpV41]|uniref:Uncharacterized protein n=1 Tax=Klebsiella phage KpV41 TaxID=1747282 RepID=A0A0S2MXP1_9CAUD|nr:hypothetical protein AU164_gp12 [Klebsiella phage KpV41]ALO80703.1 hypothetical protein kpv41_12 [Klebsiella phage KpV41]
MSKFKVGDKVVRTVRGREDKDFLRMLGEAAYYTVTSVSFGGCWLQVNGVSKVYDERPWAALNFELYQEPGDELPPVPRSVSYLKENGRRKLVACINGDSVNVLLSLSYHNITDAVGYSMEPDAALQLPHDLRRMAMEIKRKEKAL